MGQKFHFTLLEYPAYPVRKHSNGVKKHADGIQRDSNGAYGAKRIFSELSQILPYVVIQSEYLLLGFDANIATIRHCSPC